MNALPLTTRMYRALAERDAGFAGIFVVGVRTTGIFCKPGCKARTPLRENCTFFRTTAEALRAGLRPCKKCAPMVCTSSLPARSRQRSDRGKFSSRHLRRLRVYPFLRTV